MTISASLLDFGTAEIKGRSLDTAFVDSRIRLRNRILGDYKELCFTTGFINDTEFDMEREPFEASCESRAAALERYKQGHRFTSRWMVQ